MIVCDHLEISELAMRTPPSHLRGMMPTGRLSTPTEIRASVVGIRNACWGKPSTASELRELTIDWVFDDLLNVVQSAQASTVAVLEH